MTHLHHLLRLKLTSSLLIITITAMGTAGIFVIGAAVLIPASMRSEIITYPVIFMIILMLSAFFAVIWATEKRVTDIYNVAKFDEYKRKTIAKLKKLGGNPEDLDKEESKE